MWRKVATISGLITLVLILYVSFNYYWYSERRPLCPSSTTGAVCFLMQMLIGVLFLILVAVIFLMIGAMMYLLRWRPLNLVGSVTLAPAP